MITSFARALVGATLAVAATLAIVASSAAPLDAAPHGLPLTVAVPR